MQPLSVAAAQASQSTILMTAVAGLVAGAMSMAAGEYVSVHSQADTEKADLERERRELAADPAAEVRELASIYVGRGLDAALAQQVAQQLTAHDALGAHARDELEISSTMTARPVQAALTSAAAFAAGAALPLLVAAVAPASSLLVWVSGTALVFWPCWAAWPRTRAARACWWAHGASPSGARWPWPSRRAWGRCSGRRCKGRVAPP